MQRDTSEVLRLPRKMAIEVSKVLRLPRKNATHFLRESIALATQNNFRHFCRHMRMSRNATPVTQNDITTSLALLPPTRTGFAFPPWRGQKKTRDSRRDTLEHQNEHFVRDFLQFSHCVASKSTFSCEFSFEPEKFLLQNRLHPQTPRVKREPLLRIRELLKNLQTYMSLSENRVALNLIKFHGLSSPPMIFMVI